VIDVLLTSGRTPSVLALVVRPAEAFEAAPPGESGRDDSPIERAGPVHAGPALASPVIASPVIASPVIASPVEDLPGLRDEVSTFLADVEHPGAAGAVQVLPRPGRKPSAVVVVGIGQGSADDWRTAGAGLARAASGRWPSVELRLPDMSDVRAFAEGARLALYRFSLVAAKADRAPKLRRITVDPGYDRARDMVARQLAEAASVVDAVVLARDLTNTPGMQKSPKWFADRIASAAARRKGVTVKVLDEAELRAGGFGGIVAVGGGSRRPPRLVELSWRPRGASTHVVLVGKGVTFDTGGYSLKPINFMQLMRKDMGGAAAVCGAVLAAADLDIPVRVTAIAPLAENMVSGSAFRPGDVVRHYGGRTSEIRNTDAEGRVILADALAYAVKRLRPDVLVDLATLTGASHVALGKHVAALLTHDEDLAKSLTAAGDQVGERMWRLPLADEYAGLLASDVADINNSPGPSDAGVITAALYLREFTGDLRPRWAHVDMSAPSWSDTNEGPLVKGATGWGVRMLVRWLDTLT
jgi:leucyl aminopeptidase